MKTCQAINPKGSQQFAHTGNDRFQKHSKVGIAGAGAELLYYTGIPGAGLRNLRNEQSVEEQKIQ